MERIEARRRYGLPQFLPFPERRDCLDVTFIVESPACEGDQGDFLLNLEFQRQMFPPNYRRYHHNLRVPLDFGKRHPCIRSWLLRCDSYLDTSNAPSVLQSCQLLAARHATTISSSALPPLLSTSTTFSQTDAHSRSNRSTSFETQTSPTTSLRRPS